MSLITLAYNEINYLDNNKATKPRNLVEETSKAWEGIAALSPASDFWFDVVEKPDQIRTIGPSANFWEQSGEITPFEADRDSWDLISGRPGGSQWRETTDISREAEKGSNADTRIENLIIPFMRGRNIDVKVTNLKRNTRVYIFFDETDVSDSCVPTDGDLGDPIITDDNGEADFVFRLPAGQFTIGTKFLVVTNSPQNEDDATTFAIASYSSNGKATQENNEGVISTQLPRISPKGRRETPSSENSVSDSKGLAYTFYVDRSGGMFVSSFDVYFATRNMNRNVIAQIRTVTNGQPTNTIVPYGEAVVSGTQIDVSEDASEATRFSFDNPIYLEEDRDYALVLIPEGNDDGFQVWASELGDLDIETEERVVENLSGGAIYTASANKTWLERNQEELKIKINRAEFETQNDFTAEFNNQDLDVLNVGESVPDAVDIGMDIRGETFLVLETQNETFTQTVGDTIDIDGTTATIRWLDFPELLVEKDNISDDISAGDTFTDSESVTWTIQSADESAGTVIGVRSGDIYLENSNGFFREGALLRSTENLSLELTLDTIKNIIVNDLRVLSGEVLFEDTSIQWAASVYDGAAFRDINLDEGERKELRTEAVILSKSNERTELNGDKSLTVTATGHSEKSNLSPIIDRERAGVQIYSYNIDNPSSEDDAVSKYFTDMLSLDDNSEDLRVIFNARVPSGANVDVLVKVQNEADDRNSDDLDWFLIDTIGYNENDMQEYDIPVPASLKNVDGVIEYQSNGAVFTGFSRFAVQLRFRANNTSRYPVVKDLRTIALLA